MHSSSAHAWLWHAVLSVCCGEGGKFNHVLMISNKLIKNLMIAHDEQNNQRDQKIRKTLQRIFA